MQGSTTALLVFAVVLLVAVELLSQLQSLSTNLLRTYTSERLTLHFRAQLFQHAQRLSIGYHDRKGTADANYRIQSDAAAIPSVAVGRRDPFHHVGVHVRDDDLRDRAHRATLALIALVVAPAARRR